MQLHQSQIRQCLHGKDRIILLNGLTFHHYDSFDKDVNSQRIASYNTFVRYRNTNLLLDSQTA